KCFPGRIFRAPIPRCGRINTSPATWRCWSTRNTRACAPSRTSSTPARKGRNAMTAEIVAMRDNETAATLLDTCEEALAAAETLLAQACDSVAQHVMTAGQLDRRAAEENQFAVHGFAWFATYVETLRQTLDWARRLHHDSKL